jgi:hypothetical protein
LPTAAAVYYPKKSWKRFERLIKDSRPLELKGQSQDFERAKQKADKLLKSFALG